MNLTIIISASNFAHFIVHMPLLFISSAYLPSIHPPTQFRPSSSPSLLARTPPAAASELPAGSALRTCPRCRSSRLNIVMIFNETHQIPILDD